MLTFVNGSLFLIVRIGDRIWIVTIDAAQTHMVKVISPVMGQIDQFVVENDKSSDFLHDLSFTSGSFLIAYVIHYSGIYYGGQVSSLCCISHWCQRALRVRERCGAVNQNTVRVNMACQQTVTGARHVRDPDSRQRITITSTQQSTFIKQLHTTIYTVGTVPQHSRTRAPLAYAPPSPVPF